MPKDKVPGKGKPGKFHPPNPPNHPIPVDHLGPFPKRKKNKIQVLVFVDAYLRYL